MGNIDKRFLLSSGYTVIMLAAIIQIVSTIFFFSGIQISSFNFWIPLLGTIILLRFMMMYNQESLKLYAWYVGILVAIFLVGGVFSYLFYDLSYDGQAYQMETVIQIANNGWNPYTGNPVNGYVHDLWINHYPNVSWILAASVYKVTNLIETAKVFNFALLVSSFFITLSAMYTIFPKKKGIAFITAFLLACNPVVLVQITTFNNTSQVYSLLLIILCLAFQLYNEFGVWELVMLCLSLLLLVNTTFIAVVYAAVILLTFFIALLILKKTTLLKETIWPIVITFVVAMVLVGYSPYVKNTIDNGNPFYPLMGQGKVDIMTPNKPANFVNSNSLINLAHSLLSKSENQLTPSQAKMPFTVDKNEIKAFEAADVRVGGFGPFFGGTVLLAAIFLIISLIRDRKKTWYILIPGAIVLISVLINSNAWWAEQAPQLWIMPIFVVIITAALNDRISSFFSWLITVILLVNILVVFGYHAKDQYALSRQLNAQLNQLASSGKVIQVKLTNHLSNRIRFQEKNIKHDLVVTLKCKDPKTFPLSDTQYCE